METVSIDENQAQPVKANLDCLTTPMTALRTLGHNSPIKANLDEADDCMYETRPDQRQSGILNTARVDTANMVMETADTGETRPVQAQCGVSRTAHDDTANISMEPANIDDVRPDQGQWTAWQRL